MGHFCHLSPVPVRGSATHLYERIEEVEAWRSGMRKGSSGQRRSRVEGLRNDERSSAPITLLADDVYQCAYDC
jgi:hypothetical protein